ncbi:MAG TPA: hypothetical protein VHG89_04730 [Verrucomicrobiae bacterium]|nr:hypothetical protein [Verrucomicrobiae bacterium]
MSRGRSQRVTTHQLLRRATLVVPTDQADDYLPLARAHPHLDLVTIPPDRIGVSAVRNWIVRRFDEDVVVMYDDDVTALQTLCGLRNRKLKPDEIEAVVENTAYCAAGAGARLFGWNQRPDPRMLQRNDPVSVVHWCGGVVGVIGKEVRWDELLKFKCDIDCCLTELLHNRILWHESRFCFLQARDKNLGGNSLFRSPEKIAAEKRYLANKWKAHVVIDEYQSQDRVQVKVERRQKVEL